MNTKQLLDQDKIWQTRDGMPLQLPDMDPGHRSATLAFLRRRADYLAKAYAFCELRELVGASDDEMQDWMAQNGRAIHGGAQDWLERKPLIIALARMVTDDQRGPVIDGEVVDTVVVHALENR